MNDFFIFLIKIDFIILPQSYIKKIFSTTIIHFIYQQFFSIFANFNLRGQICPLATSL